jgi:hypothetical protein
VIRSFGQDVGRVLGMKIILQVRKINFTFKVALTLFQINNFLCGLREFHFDVFLKLSSHEMADDIKYIVAQPNLPLVLCIDTLFRVVQRKLFSLVMRLRVQLRLITEKSTEKQS